MNARLTALAVPLGFVAMLGCTETPEPVAAPQPAPPPVAAPPAPDFRAAAPSAGPAVVFAPPKIDEARLANGVRILLVESHALPIVAVHVTIDVGADQAGPGVGAFAGATLMRGTKTRSAIALSDELSALGATADAWSDFDATQVAGKALTDKLPQLLSIVADVIEHPAFAKDEIDRERSRRLTAISQQKDRPRTILSNTIAELLYPAGSAYSLPLIGTEETVKKVTAKDLQAFHARFAPGAVTVALAGDIDKARAVAEVERAFGSWKGAAPKAPGADQGGAAHAGAPRVLLVDRPGASQSSVSISAVGLPRKTPDFDALVVMNTLLGGQFSSRLNMNLREAHAYTYGAFSAFDFRHRAGPFGASAEIVRESTGPGVGEALHEIERIRTELVTEEELSDAKAYLIKQLPARFETVSATAGTLAGLAIYDLPLDEYATRPARFARITREDVKRVAQSALKGEGLHVVVVGDAKVVKPQLEALKLGEVALRAVVGPTAPGAAAKH